MIEQIKQALAAATPGPWKDAPDKVEVPNEHYREIRAGKGYHTSPFTKDTGFSITGYITPENARIMSHSPEWLRYLIGEVERLNQVYEIANIDRKRLNEEIEELRKALEWYADPDSWRVVHIKGDHYASPAHDDTGDRAREYLERVERSQP